MTHQAESKIKQKVQKGVSILQIVLHGHIPKSRGQTSSWVNSCLFKQRDLLTQHWVRGHCSDSTKLWELWGESGWTWSFHPWRYSMPTETSSWTCFVQGVDQGNILPTSAVPWSFNIPFKHNLFDQKKDTPSAIISVRLLKGKKKTLHPQISGKVQDSFGLCRWLNTWENILKIFIKIMHKPRRHMQPYRILIFSI